MEKSRFSKEVTLVIKGVVVLMMVCHHLFRTPKGYAGYNISFFPFTEERINNLFTFFKLCVGTFAFISGYGLSIKWKEYKEKKEHKKYYIDQYIKSMANYWIVFIIVLIICQLIDGSTQKIYFSNKFLVNIFNLATSFSGFGSLLGINQIVYEWWYMGACIIFVCAVPVLTEIIKKHGGFPVIILIISIPRLLGIEFLGGTSPWSFMMPVTLGIIFQENNLLNKEGIFYTQYKNNVSRVIEFIVLIAALYFTYKIYIILPFENFWEVKYSIPPIVIILICKEIVYPVKFLKEIFTFFGKHSVNIYLVHTVILKYCKAFILGQVNFVISCLILILFSLIASSVIEMIKKTIKYKEFISFISIKIRKNICE